MNYTGQVTSKLETFYMLNNRKSLEFRYDPTSIHGVNTKNVPTQI